jgi:hypothetical protein
MEEEIAGDSDAEDRVPLASNDISGSLLADQSTLTTVAMLNKLSDEPETKVKNRNF